MKNLYITFAVAVAIVCGTVAYNNIIGDEEIQDLAVDIDLNQNNTLDDLVFDKEGHLIAGTTYEWNEESDTKGEAIAKLHCN